MGKRKAPVPRRRVGVHFVDLPLKRPSRARVEESPSPTADGSATENGESPTAAAASLPASTTHGAHEPTDAATQPMMQAPVQPQQANGHLQHGRSITSTVPLRTASSPSTMGMSTMSTPLSRPEMPAASDGDTVDMTMAELNAWKQRTVLEIEDHFTNEQLKRIAEFGRVHANLLKEAKEYVFGIETQLKEQFEKERESLRGQAEAYVAQFQEENEQLRAHIDELEAEIDELRGGQRRASLDDNREEEAEPEEAEETSGGRLSTGSTNASNGEGHSLVTNHHHHHHPTTPQTHTGQEHHSPVRLEDVTETMSRAMGLTTPIPAAPKAIAPRVANGLELP